MSKLLLFDLDGVLVDACEWHYIALNKALNEVCGFEISRHDHETTFNGLPTAIKLEMLGIDNNKSSMIWELKQKYTIESIKTHAQIDKQKVDMHTKLKDEGYKIGCVTNSIRKTARLMLEKTGQIDYMDMIVTNEDVENSKPHPDCYLKSISDFGFEGSEYNVYIIEDSEKGRQAARQTEANLIEVLNPADVTYQRIIEEIQKNENTDTYGR